MRRLQHRVRVMETIALAARYFKRWAWMAIFGVAVWGGWILAVTP